MTKQSDLEQAMAFAIKASALPEPTAEYPFAQSLGRKWRFDFAYPEAKVALEVEGGTWVGGAHNRGQHMASDIEKYNMAALMGWLVIRANNHMVKDNRAVDTLRLALIQRGAI